MRRETIFVSVRTPMISNLLIRRRDPSACASRCGPPPRYVRRWHPPRNIVNTMARRELRRLGLSGEERAWGDLLQTGVLPGLRAKHDGSPWISRRDIKCWFQQRVPGITPQAITKLLQQVRCTESFRGSNHEVAGASPAFVQARPDWAALSGNRYSGKRDVTRLAACRA